MLLVTYVNIYAKIREYLEIHPSVATIYDANTGQSYDASMVYANLIFALNYIAEQVIKYLKTPITNTFC